MVSQIVTIDDILQEGKQRKVRLATGGLFLIPKCHPINKTFLYNPLRLGVIESFGEKEKRRFVRIVPCYEINMPENGDLTKAVIGEMFGSFYLDFFPTMYTGSAEEIARALTRTPFSKMERLADAIRRIDVPYNVSLAHVFKKIKGYSA